MKKSLNELIPKPILNALVNGAGRNLISEKFGLSDTDARKFVNTYEIFNLSNPIDFYEIDDSGYGDRQAKVLLFDIETAPMVGYIWGREKQYIQPNQIITDWFMFSWAAKWLHDSEIISNRLTSREATSRDDKLICELLWNMIDSADIVIAHYGDKFDIRRMNGRFFLHGMRLPSPYQSIDTCKTARSRMHLTSYALNEVGIALGIGQKIKTDFSLWDRCYRGDVGALKEMELYNRQDVQLLEDVYLKLRPYIKNHPNMGLYIDRDVSLCPVCGHDKLIESGEYVTSVSRFTSYYCDKCYAILRDRLSNVSKEKRKNLMVSVVR